MAQSYSFNHISPVNVLGCTRSKSVEHTGLVSFAYSLDLFELESRALSVQYISNGLVAGRSSGTT